MFTAVSRRSGLLACNVNNFKYHIKRSTALVKKDTAVVNLTIIGSSGQHYQVQGNEGWSLVQTIQKNNLQGEFQDFGVCFGSSFCCTCHVYFKPEDFNKIPKLDEDSDEQFYLEEIPNYIPGSSRLACQIKLDKFMNNMEVCRPKKCLGTRIVPP